MIGIAHVQMTQLPEAIHLEARKANAIDVERDADTFRACS